MKALKLSLIALAIAGFAGTSQAADTSAKVDLKGTVGVNCGIAVKPTAKATNLDILNGEKNTQVASVVENCNSGTGYTVQVTSGNKGQLVSDARGASPVSFEASYDDAKGAIADALVAERAEAYFDRVGSLAVSFNGNPRAIAGVYADVLTVTIAAK